MQCVHADVCCSASLRMCCGYASHTCTRHVDVHAHGTSNCPSVSTHHCLLFLIYLYMDTSTTWTQHYIHTCIQHTHSLQRCNVARQRLSRTSATSKKRIRGEAKSIFSVCSCVCLVWSYCWSYLFIYSPTVYLYFRSNTLPISPYRSGWPGRRRRTQG